MSFGSFLLRLEGDGVVFAGTGRRVNRSPLERNPEPWERVDREAAAALRVPDENEIWYREAPPLSI